MGRTRKQGAGSEEPENVEHSTLNIERLTIKLGRRWKNRPNGKFFLAGWGILRDIGTALI